MMSLILMALIFASNAALADGPLICEVFESLEGKKKLCWNDEKKAWLTEYCIHSSCKATSALEQEYTLPKKKVKYGGSNPDTRICHHLKLKVLIMRDLRRNEQTFCGFPDASIVDASALARRVKR